MQMTTNHSEAPWFSILISSVASLLIPAAALFLSQMLWALHVNDFLIMQLAMLCFPLSFLFGIVGFCIQCPIYAAVFVLSWFKGRLKTGITVILLAHTSAVVWGVTHFKFAIST